MAENYTYTVRGDDATTKDRQEYDVVSRIAQGLAQKLQANGIELDEHRAALLGNVSDKAGKEGFQGTFADYLDRNKLREAFDKMNATDSLTHYLIFANGITDGKGEICGAEVVVDAVIHPGQKLAIPLIELTHDDVDIISVKSKECPPEEKVVDPIAVALDTPPAPEMVSVEQVVAVPGQFVGAVGTRQGGQAALDMANYFMGKPPTDPAAHGGSPVSVWEGARVLLTAQFGLDIFKGLKGERQIDTSLAQTEVLLKPEQVVNFDVTKDGNIITNGIKEGKEKRFKYEITSGQELHFDTDGKQVTLGKGGLAGATISLKRKEGGHNHLADAKTARADLGDVLNTPDGTMALTGYVVVDNERTHLQGQLQQAQANYKLATEVKQGNYANNAAMVQGLAKQHQTLAALHAIEMMVAENESGVGKDGAITALVNDFSKTGLKGDNAFEKMFEKQAKDLRNGKTDLNAVHETLAKQKPELLQALTSQLANNATFSNSLANKIGTPDQHLNTIRDMADKALQMDARQLVNPLVWSIRPHNGIETQRDVIATMERTVASITEDAAIRNELQATYVDGLTHYVPAKLEQELAESGILTHNPATRQIEERVELDFIHAKNAYGGKDHDAKSRDEQLEAQKQQAREYGEKSWRAVEAQSYRSASQFEQEVGAGLLSNATESRNDFQAREGAAARHVEAEKSADLTNALPKETGQLRDWVKGVGGNQHAMQQLMLAAIATRDDGSLKHPQAVGGLLRTAWFATRDDSFSPLGIRTGLGTGTQGAKEFGMKDRQADRLAEELEQLLGEQMKGDLREPDAHAIKDTFRAVVRLVTIGVADPGRGVNQMDTVSEDAVTGLQRLAKKDPAAFSEVARRFGEYMQLAADTPRTAQFAQDIATSFTTREGEADDKKVSAEMQAFYAAADKANGMQAGGSGNLLDTVSRINHGNWAGLEQSTEAYVLRNGDVGVSSVSPDKIDNLRAVIKSGSGYHTTNIEVPKGQEASVKPVVYMTSLDVSRAQQVLAQQELANSGQDLTALRGAALAAALQQNLEVYAKLDNPEKFTKHENDLGLAAQTNRSAPELLAAHAVAMMAAEADTSRMNSTARRKNKGEISKTVDALSRKKITAEGQFEELIEKQAEKLRAGDTDMPGVLKAIQTHLDKRGGRQESALARLNAELMSNANFNASFAQSLLATGGVGAVGAQSTDVNALLAGGNTLAGVVGRMDEATQQQMAGLLTDPAALNALANGQTAVMQSLLAERGVSVIEAAKLAVIIYAVTRKPDPKEPEQEGTPINPTQPPGTQVPPGQSNPTPTPKPPTIEIPPGTVIPPIVPPTVIPPVIIKPIPTPKPPVIDPGLGGKDGAVGDGTGNGGAKTNDDGVTLNVTPRSLQQMLNADQSLYAGLGGVSNSKVSADSLTTSSEKFAAVNVDPDEVANLAGGKKPTGSKAIG